LLHAPFRRGAGGVAGISGCLLSRGVVIPKVWLFPGARPGGPLSPRSVQKVFERAREKGGIHKAATVHTLRHSLAAGEARPVICSLRAEEKEGGEVS